jgi:hypothetical protein
MSGSEHNPSVSGSAFFVMLSYLWSVWDLSIAILLMRLTGLSKRVHRTLGSSGGPADLQVQSSPSVSRFQGPRARITFEPPR